MFSEECIRLANTFQALQKETKEDKEPKEEKEPAESGQTTPRNENYTFEGARIVFADFMQGREGESRPYVEVEDLKKYV